MTCTPAGHHDHLPCPARNQESVHSSSKRCDRRDPDAPARRVRLPTLRAPAGFDERNLLAGAKPMSIATARTPQPSRPSATDQCARRCMPEAQGMVAGRYACRGAVGPSPASVTSWMMRTVNHEVAQGMSCTQHDTPVRLTSRMPCTRTRPHLRILTHCRSCVVLLCSSKASEASGSQAIARGSPSLHASTTRRSATQASISFSQERASRSRRSGIADKTGAGDLPVLAASHRC